MAELTAAQQSHFDELHDTINKQHAMLVKLATSNKTLSDNGPNQDRDHDQDKDRGANRGRRDFDPRHDFGSRDQGTPCLGARGPYGGRTDNASQGCSLCPDLRHCPFLPNVICAACKRTGHEATSCDMLAIALFVERHKDQMSKAEKSSMEMKWTARWRDKIGQPNRTPWQVMWAYCNELDITAEHLIAAMDWDCWPASDDDVFANK